MTTKFEIGKSLSAAICALLFGSTMILSAVGPARAAGSDVVTADLAQSQSTAASPYRA